MKFRIRLALIVSTIAAGFVFASATNADVIQLQSSGAAKFLAGPLDAGFGFAFTPANFTSAQNGASAFVVTPNALWIQTLPSNAGAHCR